MAKRRIHEFTVTEQRILKLLGDGMLHGIPELQACLEDDMATVCALLFHLKNIREKIAPKGRTIATVRNNKKTYYQLCITMASPYDGSK